MTVPKLKPDLILASQSPRRRQLLTDAGYSFSVLPPADDVERSAEMALPDDLSPDRLVIELALQKARHVAEQVTTGLILAADTIAECHGQVLGKPKSRTDARRMLLAMSGKRHKVLTGVCCWSRPDDHFETFLETTVLRMHQWPMDQLETYLDSGDWQDKAGAFGYQDDLDWVQIESGLASNVVGLPVERLPLWLERF